MALYLLLFHRTRTVMHHFNRRIGAMQSFVSNCLEIFIASIFDPIQLTDFKTITALFLIYTVDKICYWHGNLYHICSIRFYQHMQFHYGCRLVDNVFTPALCIVLELWDFMDVDHKLWCFLITRHGVAFSRHLKWKNTKNYHQMRQLYFFLYGV